MAEVILVDVDKEFTESESERGSKSYVRITIQTETDIPLAAIKPESLVIEEMIGTPYVTCGFTFEDTFGIFVNEKQLESDYRFNVIIGRSPTDYVKYTMKLYKIDHRNRALGVSGQYLTTIILKSFYWDEMSVYIKNRGFANTQFSEVVQTIANDSGIDNTLITPSIARQNVIQPYWTDYDMLKWCTDRTVGSLGSHYSFGATANDGFFFCPLSELYAGATRGLNIFETTSPRIFTFSGDEVLEEPVLQADDIIIDVDYGDVMRKGGSGTIGARYDYITGTYSKQVNTLSASTIPQLSDWGSIAPTQERPSFMSYGGDDPDALSIAKNVLSKESLSFQDIIIMSAGYNDHVLGEKIRVIMPLSEDFSDFKFGVHYAGDYLLTAKQTTFTFSKSAINVVSKLRRHGVNGPVVDNLAQSDTGKSNG